MRIRLVVILLALGCLTACGNPNKVSGISDNEFADGYDTSFEDTILIGDADRAEITDVFNAHNWVFEGEAGQSLIIEVRGDGYSDPRFKLYDENLTVIAEADDGEDTVNALAEVTLPQTGRYILRIDMWAPGEYVVTLEEQ